MQPIEMQYNPPMANAIVIYVHRQANSDNGPTLGCVTQVSSALWSAEIFGRQTRTAMTFNRVGRAVDWILSSI